MDQVLLAEQTRLVRRLREREGPGMYKMSEITSHIFISAWPLSENWEELRDNNIRAILTVENTPKKKEILRRYKSMRIAHKQVELDDAPKAPLLDVLEATYAFIHEHVAQQRAVLVHCQQGVSRSVAVVAAYYLRRLYAVCFKGSLQATRQIVDAESFLLGAALSKVQEARPCAKPNSGFIMQLLIYELRLKRPYREELQQELREYLERTRRRKEQELGEEVDLYHEELQMTLDEYLGRIFRGEEVPDEEAHELPSDDLGELAELVERFASQ